MITQHSRQVVWKSLFFCQPTQVVTIFDWRYTLLLGAALNPLASPEQARVAHVGLENFNVKAFTEFLGVQMCRVIAKFLEQKVGGLRKPQIISNLFSLCQKPIKGLR